MSGQRTFHDKNSKVAANQSFAKSASARPFFGFFAKTRKNGRPSQIWRNFDWPQLCSFYHEKFVDQSLESPWWDLSNDWWENSIWYKTAKLWPINFFKIALLFSLFFLPTVLDRYMKNIRPVGLKFFRKFLKIKKLILGKFGGQTSKKCKKIATKTRGSFFTPRQE